MSEDTWDTIIFKLTAAQAIDTEDVRRMNGCVVAQPTLLVITAGADQWMVNGAVRPLETGSVLLALAGDCLHTAIGAPERLRGYKLSFQAAAMTDNGYVRPGRLEERWSVRLSDLAQLEDTLERIRIYAAKPRALDRMKANLWFQEWVHGLLSHMADDASKPAAQQSVARTIEYMERHYSEDIAREQLAAMAGMSANYYSRMFKLQTGLSPFEYLNGIRMRHAKRLLLFSALPLHRIAHRIGYRDEYYFSRKFKEATGCPPTVYVSRKKQSRNIVSLSTAYTGHLLALGVEPRATLMHPSYNAAARLGNSIILGSDTPDFSKLNGQSIDLILCFDNGREDDLERLQRMAPTYAIPFHPLEWREHLRMIAAIIGKEAEAGEWLARYELKAQEVRRRIARRIGGGSVVIVAHGREGLAIYGHRNMGSVLYGDLRLQPAAKAADIYHFRTIDAWELAEYDADHMIVVDDGAGRAEPLSAIVRSEPWHDLTAVRKRQVYQMSGRRWGGYNPLSNEWILDDMLRLFSVQ